MEWERKQSIVKKKPGHIDIATVEAIESVYGTNRFDIDAEKWVCWAWMISRYLEIECFSNAGKTSLLPGLQKLCEEY